MIHWKVLVMRPQIAPYAVEFDSEQAARAASAFFRRGGFETDVIKDDETEGESEVEPDPEQLETAA